MGEPRARSARLERLVRTHDTQKGVVGPPAIFRDALQFAALPSVVDVYGQVRPNPDIKHNEKRPTKEP